MTTPSYVVERSRSTSPAIASQSSSETSGKSPASASGTSTSATAAAYEDLLPTASARVDDRGDLAVGDFDVDAVRPEVERCREVLAVTANDAQDPAARLGRVGRVGFKEPDEIGGRFLRRLGRAVARGAARRFTRSGGRRSRFGFARAGHGGLRL